MPLGILRITMKRALRFVVYGWDESSFRTCGEQRRTAAAYPPSDHLAYHERFGI
jgi:hypothetical protein